MYEAEVKFSDLSIYLSIYIKRTTPDLHNVNPL